MLLDRLTVSNYRRLAHLTIDFHPQLTVISARNGEGKTAILDAAATALGSYVQAFDPGGLQDIQVTDARLVRGRTITGGERQFPVEIVAEALVPEGYTGTEQRVVWRRSLRDPHSRQITDEGANPFATIADQLQADLRADREVPLPALSYYGSNRLQQLHSTKLDKKKPTRSRHAGYQGCLSNYLSHSQLQEWMRDATAAAAQPHQGNRSDPDLSDAVAGIAWSVEEVLGPLAQWSSFRHDIPQDELAMTQAGQLLLPLSLLSDGVRAMVCLTADLALRCVQLNPMFGAEASKRTRGIVLIDEVDLHLHPQWQQQVLHSLTSAFPLIQFIVTTHSPQVLSTVPADQIRVIAGSDTGSWSAAAPVEQTLGVESGHVLGEVMGVDPVPPVEAAKILSDYIIKIETGTHEDAEGVKLRATLLDLYSNDHPIVRSADQLILFQGLKQRAFGREAN